MERPQSYYGRAPADRNRIDVTEPQELRWWCGRFGCSDLRLIEAVTQVGNAPAQVEQFLRFSASFDARSLSKPGPDKVGPRRKMRPRRSHPARVQEPLVTAEPRRPDDAQAGEPRSANEAYATEESVADHARH